MALPELHKTASGALGASQGVNTTICFVTCPRGRYTIRGSGRHTLADGVKVSIAQDGANFSDIITMPQAANSVGTLPLITVDTLNRNSIIALKLAVATGASDAASGALSIQLEQPN